MSQDVCNGRCVGHASEFSASEWKPDPACPLHGTGQQPAQPRRCCRKHEAEDLNGRIFGRLFIVCPTCQDKRCPHADDCANACSQQPAQPESGEAWRSLPWFQLDAIRRLHAASVASGLPLCNADKDRAVLIDALTAAQQRIAAMREAFAMIRLFAQDGIENGHDRAQIGNQYAIRDLCNDFLKEPK